MKAIFYVLPAAAALLTACADYPPPGPAPVYVAVDAPAPAPADSCFRSSDIRNHTVGDDRTIYINVLNNDVYRLETSGACASPSDISNPLVIRSVGGNNLVCRPIDLDLSISRNGFVTPCIVSSIVRMTPAEVAALPPKLRP